MFRTEEIRTVVELQMSARERAECGPDAPPSAVTPDVLSMEHMESENGHNHHHQHGTGADVETGVTSGRAVFALDDETQK